MIQGRKYRLLTNFSEGLIGVGINSKDSGKKQYSSSPSSQSDRWGYFYASSPDIPKTRGFGGWGCSDNDFQEIQDRNNDKNEI